MNLKFLIISAAAAVFSYACDGPAPAVPRTTETAPAESTTAAPVAPAVYITVSPIGPLSTITPDVVRGAACLQGEWTLLDPGVYFATTLEVSGSQAEFKGVTGSLGYVFSPDGRMSILYDELSVSLDARVEGGRMATRSTLDGSAEADYISREDGQLALSHFGGDGVLYIIEVDGQILMQADLPAWASFFAALTQASGGEAQAVPVPEEVLAAYDCAGDRLVLRGQGNLVEMELARKR